MTRTTRFFSAVMTMALAVGLTAAPHAQDPKPQTPQSTRRSAQPAISTPININTASASELEALPGVGPAMAARIVEFRAKNGGFKKLEDLMNVMGIGEKTFLKLKPLVTIAPIKFEAR
jgi:competence protein ComEA